MPRPTVFISHSTERFASDPYLTAICDRLKAGDRYRVLLDREGLRVSDDWNSRIVNWVASCHAAVVIFSARALQSNYVKFEVANLFARWQRHDRRGERDAFVFCGVVPKGVDPGQLRAGYFGDIRIPDAQMLCAASPEEAAREILERLEPLRCRLALPPTPLDELRNRVELMLEQLDPRLILMGLRAMGRQLPDGDESAVNALADALLCSPLSDGLRALQAMRPMPRPSFAREMFELMAPSWVGPEAALALYTRLTEGRDQAAHVTLNAEYPTFTPAMYLRRATGNQLAASGQVLDLTTVTARRGITAAALARDVRCALLSRLASADVDPDGPDAVVELRAALRFERAANRATLVALRLSPSRLRTLRAALDPGGFPGVTFVALCGGANRNDEFLLRPELQDKQEQDAFDTYRRAERVVEVLTNG